jgi:hypothetical protein
MEIPLPIGVHILPASADIVPSIARTWVSTGDLSSRPFNWRIELMKQWFFLSIAIVCEIIGTSFLKSADGFSRFWPSAIVVVGYAAAFYFLSLTTEDNSGGCGLCDLVGRRDNSDRIGRVDFYRAKAGLSCHSGHCAHCFGRSNPECLFKINCALISHNMQMPLQTIHSGLQVEQSIGCFLPLCVTKWIFEPLRVISSNLFFSQEKE